MTRTLQFSSDDTRESALRKAGAWYDRIADDNVAKFATAIGQADVSCEDMMAAIDQGRILAVEGRAPFLAHVARVLDEIIAIRRSP
jgi:hypothetical protein